MRISDWSSDVCSSDLKKYKHDIEVVVDRVAVREDLETRLADSFETALKLADGLAYVDLADTTVAEAMSASPLPLAGGVGGGPVSDPAEAGRPSPNPSPDRAGNPKGAAFPHNRMRWDARRAGP